MKEQGSTDQLLRRNPSALEGPGGAGVCLDAETIAAWSEGSLRAERRAAAQAHAADCDRCLGVLAALGTTQPVPAPKSWAGWLPLRWLVPPTVAATAVFLWVLVDRPPEPAGGSRTSVEQSATGGAPQPERPQSTGRYSLPSREALEAPAAVQAPGDSTRREAPPADGPPAAPATGSPAASGSPPAGASSLPGAPRTDAGASPARGPARTETGPPAARRDVPPATTASPPPPPAAAPDTAPGTPTAADAQDRTRAARDRNALAETLAIGPEVAGAPGEDTAPGRVRAPARSGSDQPVDVVSPDPAFRWRIMGTAIDRSIDGGRTWLRQATDAVVPLLAGSAPSPTVCWVAGRSGTILRSTDGETWTRVPFSDTTDIVAITASDALTATVTTSGARTYRTRDGGRTWTLQENPAAPF